MNQLTVSLPDDFAKSDKFESYSIYCNEMNEHERKSYEYRMQNYYNCIDDYSWGGRCDQSADQARRKRDYLLNTLKFQIEQDCPISDSCDISVLIDIETNQIVSQKIVNGKFGPCWIIEGDNVNFVSVAKKQLTYNKKGYMVATKRYFFEKYVTTDLKVVVRNISFKVLDIFPEYQTTILPTELWIKLQNA